MDKSTEGLAMDSSAIKSHESAMKSTWVRSLTVFATAVVTATVLVTGVIAAAYIVQNGGNEVACPTTVRSEVQAQTNNQLMDKDVAKDMEIREENGVTHIEHVTYSTQDNTVLIDISGNVTGVSIATAALDFNKKLVFISTHEDNMCLAFTLEDEIAANAQEFLESDQNEVIDVLSDAIITESYADHGEIPAGYVRSTNGPIVQGLCAGKPTKWLEYTTEDLSEGRQKRGCYIRYYCYYFYGWRCYYYLVCY